MKKSWFFRTMVLALILFLLTTIQVFSYNNTVESFRASLRNDDVNHLRQIVSPNGLVLVRSHNINRGQDTIYKVSIIPENLQIPAPDGLAFDLKFLFGSLVRRQSLTYLEDNIQGIYLNDNSIHNIRSFAQTVLNFINLRSRSYTPTVVGTDGQYIILTDAELNDEMMSGSMAIFINQGGSYYLRMIIDLR